jgi:hypothetical protein
METVVRLGGRAGSRDHGNNADSGSAAGGPPQTANPAVK